MSTKTIPAQTIKSCDACQRVMDGRNSIQEGHLYLKRHALDMQGSPCADASVKLDLCDSCLHTVAKAINTGVDAARAAQAQGGTPNSGGESDPNAATRRAIVRAAAEIGAKNA